jgi:hypothetical protein
MLSSCAVDADLAATLGRGERWEFLARHVFEFVGAFASGRRGPLVGASHDDGKTNTSLRVC